MSNTTATVTCMVCGRSMSTINNKHLAQHGLTAEAYKAAYPGTPLLSEKAQAKLSARSVRSNAERKGKPRSEEDLTAIRAGIAKRPSRKGIKRGPMPEETKAKLRASKRAGFDAGMVGPRTGAVLSEETRAKISAALTGRKVGPEPARKALETKRARGYDLAFMRGKYPNEETRRKISEKSSAYFAATREARRQHMIEKITQSNLTLLNSVTDDTFHLRCNACNYEFTRTAQMFQPQKWNSEVCDQCYPWSLVSGAESELAEFVCTLVPQETIRRSNRSVLKRMELDIHIPSRNLAIEYCGLYWHSDVYREDTYHLDKWRACRDENIDLIQVFEDEWINHRSAVENLIRLRLARQTAPIEVAVCNSYVCNGSEVDDLAKEFIDRTSLCGLRNNSTYYFLKSVRGIHCALRFTLTSNDDRLLEEFLYDSTKHVEGGHAALFAEFARRNNPNQIDGCADLRWDYGQGYADLGFECSGEPSVKEWFFASNSLLRQEPSETLLSEACECEALNKICDAGHVRWVWIKPE